MCGISVIVNKNNGPVNQADIERMSRLVIHRGPDDYGYFFGSNFAFGHRRLAIIDLTASGHQPMHYINRYVIIYNGEIYNYIELKNELIKSGYDFKSTSDTEVILAAYDRWGKDCVNLFNGMWAFVIYDRTEDILFFSRDRFGIKPLYYTETEDLFIFGSEIKQLLDFCPQRHVNLNVLLNYLFIGLEDYSEETFFDGIFKLEPSHNLTYNLKNHSRRKERYYELQPVDEIRGLCFEDSKKVFRDQLVDSIRLRLRTDVSIGSCLSGGLDSSSMATLASKLYVGNAGDRFIAITAKSFEKKRDESSYARMIARNSDLNLFITEPTIEDFLKNINHIIRIQEEPFGSPSILMQYFVFRKAREIGCKVLLDGQGGDETLMGYERYYIAYLFSIPAYKFLNEFILSCRNSILTFPRLLSYLFYFTSPKLRYSRLRRNHNFIKKEYLKFVDCELICKNCSGFKDVFELQKSDIQTFQLACLLKYGDKNSTASSIENRLPYLDYRLVETALSLSVNMKIHDGFTKYILRKVMESEMPGQVAWRKKKFGFFAPENFWRYQYDRLMLESIKKSSILNKITNLKFLGKIYKNINFKTKWKLFNIAEWEKSLEIRIH